MTLHTPTAVIFDWDNTLVDTWPLIHTALNITFVEMGHPEWTIEQTKKNVHRAMRDSFPILFGHEWEKAAEIYQGYFKANHLKELRALPDAEMLLSALRANTHLYMALVSNKRGINLRKEVTHIGWDKYFDKVIGADDADKDKPHPAPGTLALEGSGIEFGKHIWMIGDSITDMEFAHNTGMTPIFYGDDDPTQPQFADHPPQKHLRTHRELLSLFETMGIVVPEKRNAR